MSTKTTIIGTILIAVSILVFGLVVETRLPESMAIHWNMQGEADGYGSHFMGIWFMPILIIGLNSMLALIPLIEPRKENFKKFQKEYNGFILFFGFYLAYIQLLTLFWNLGMQFSLQNFLIPVIGGFIFYIGVLVSKVKSNYFVGIRTPWTLQDERVWADTHRLGSKLFKASGLFALIGVFFPSISLMLLLIPVIITTIVTVVYSYLRYRQYHQKGQMA